MATVTVRVPDELKEAMDEFDVNWSQAIRDMIEERLRRMRRKRAAEEMDRLAKAVFERTSEYADASGTVIEWRRRR